MPPELQPAATEIVGTSDAVKARLAKRFMVPRRDWSRRRILFRNARSFCLVSRRGERSRMGERDGIGLLIDRAARGGEAAGRGAVLEGGAAGEAVERGEVRAGDLEGAATLVGAGRQQPGDAARRRRRLHE